MTDAFDDLGLSGVRPLSGGHQSKVVRARSAGREVVLKLVRARVSARAEVVERVRMVVELSALTPLVCRPVEVDGQLVRDVHDPDLGDAHLVAYEHADGAVPDPTRPNDAESMGRVLAELHRAMRRLGPFDLPVHRLAGGRPGPEARQLLHGDFGAANVRATPIGWRVFDFDDSGYGEAAHDIANALYLILFDAVVDGVRPGAVEAWTAFVTGYERSAATVLDPDRLHAIVDDRVDLLASWLAEPAAAPTGVGDASPAWKDTLHRFVAAYRAGSYERFRLDRPR